MLLGDVFYKWKLAQLFILLFWSFVSLLIFYGLVLSIAERGGLKYPTVIVDLSISLYLYHFFLKYLKPYCYIYTYFKVLYVQGGLTPI